MIDPITAFIEREAIRSIDRRPDHWQGYRYCVHLQGGGHSGAGDTVEAALAEARALNAGYLDGLAA